MQRAARSIVPTDNREGFVNDGTDNSTVSNADSAAAVNAAPAAASQPAEPVRRRRGGRRVVRGTGAAGASLELQVQERAPLFEAPALPGCRLRPIPSPIPAIPMNPAIPRIPPNVQPAAVRAAVSRTMRETPRRTLSYVRRIFQRYR